MQIDDFSNSYAEAIKSLKKLNNTAEDSIIYVCHVYIYAVNGEFSFTVGERNSTVAINETCVTVKNYIKDKLSDIDVIDLAGIAAVRYIFSRTKR